MNFKQKAAEYALFDKIAENYPGKVICNTYLAGVQAVIDVLKSKEAEKEFGTNYETEGLTKCIADWLETLK